MRCRWVVCGQLGGGRLMLKGGGPRVTWAQNSGRSAVMAVTRMHRLLFSRGKPATGTLHVAGHRGGEELTLRLSRPRYNAARGTVSYAVKRMKGRLPSRKAGAAGAPRMFGAASLSIVGAPQTTDGPSIQLQMNTYGCPNDPAGLTCFGTVSASGLAGGTEVNSFIDGISQPINTFPTDRNGNLDPTRLAMVCGNVSAASVSGQAPNGTTVAASGNAPC